MVHWRWKDSCCKYVNKWILAVSETITFPFLFPCCAQISAKIINHSQISAKIMNHSQISAKIMNHSHKRQGLVHNHTRDNQSIVAQGQVVTSARQITKVKQCREWLVLGWVTSARVTLLAMYRGRLSYHAASAHPAVMGTWWNEKAKNCNDWL